MARRPARVRTRLHTNVCVHAARLGHRQSDKFALSPNRPRSRYRGGNAFPDTGEIVLQIVEESALFFPPPLPTPHPSRAPRFPDIARRFRIDRMISGSKQTMLTGVNERTISFAIYQADSGIVTPLQGILSSHRPI